MHSAVNITGAVCVDWERTIGALGVKGYEIWASATDNRERHRRMEVRQGGWCNRGAESGEIVLAETAEEVTDEDDEVALLSM